MEWLCNRAVDYQSPPTEPGDDEEETNFRGPVPVGIIHRHIVRRSPSPQDVTRTTISKNGWLGELVPAARRLC